MTQKDKTKKELNEEKKLLQKRIAELETVDTEHKQAENRKRLVINVLDRLNHPGIITDTIHDILQIIQKSREFEAAGIRLHEKDDFPYYETIGFPASFVQKERYLCTRDKAGKIVCDAQGNPLLECMCGNVLCGRTNPKFPFFTEGGSFWSNCTTELLASTTEKDRQAHTRNRCNGEGYESVALIPLKEGDEVIGLLQLNDHRRNQFTLEIIQFFEGLGASIGIAIGRQRAEKALAISLSKERKLARLDMVTGISNSRRFYEFANMEMSRSQRYKRPLTVAYADVDNFKNVNDKFGHDKGDKLLRLIATNIKKNIRKNDMVSRIGGDEFAILFPETNKIQAKVAVNSVIKKINKIVLAEKLEVTLSVGVITCIPESCDIQKIIKEADKKMYYAKKHGKNRIRY